MPAESVLTTQNTVKKEQSVSLMTRAIPRMITAHGVRELLMTDETEDPSIVATRTGTPPCPACQDVHQIEPLLQVDGVWHVRCLRCGYGFRIAPASSNLERRRNEERRTVARSGRRAADLQHPVHCARCGGEDVHGWIRTGETLWARCRTCGCVQRVADEG